jgi:glycosyltransferase involved in cell wall biosynthesis
MKPALRASLGKITYLNGKFTAQRMTGVQRVAAELVRALDAQVDGSWVLLCPAGADLPVLQRIQVRQLGWPGLPLHLWEQCLLPWAARDGLLVNLAGAAPAYARRQACMLHDAAVFDHPESYTRLFGSWYRWLFRRLVQRAERLLTVSAFSRERLVAHLGADAARLCVVGNGCDHLLAVQADETILDRHGLRSRRYMLAVASDNRTKNLATLLRAYASLGCDPGFSLVVVGGRNGRVFTGSTVADPPGVLRTGPLQDAALKALYTHALALVFPSLYEGFGLPPLEAMACACPVAAARAAALPEVCGDAVLYFDPSSEFEIAAALVRLAQQPELRANLSDAGRLRAAQFRWRDSAAVMLAILRPVDES